MRRMLPSVVELSILATLAVLAAAVLISLGQPSVIPFVTFPLLIVSMLLGARRMGHLAPARQPVIARATRSEQQAQQA